MPYSSVGDLPPSLYAHLSPEARRLFVRVFNAAFLKCRGNESMAFAVAWQALKRAGFKKNGRGVWTR